ncbi:MAG: RHS repeat-associated core domain-containing protein [Silvibacterium sp.]
MIAGLASPRLMAQTPALSSIDSPYPAVQSTVRIAGGTYGPGSVPYGPVGTPLVLSGSDFGASGTVVFTSYHNGVAGSSVAATVTSWSETILFLTVPSGATSGLVFVKADGKTSNGLPFIVTSGSYSGSCPNSPPSSELQITTSSLPNGTVSQGYTATLNATGGTPPYTWSLTGTLPAGLSLSASSGAITGTPTTAGGPVALTVKAVDSHSQATDAVLDISIDSQTLTSTIVYSYSVPNSGGFDPNGNVRLYNDTMMGTWNFNYDNLNRLSSAIPGTGAPGGYAGENLCMNYDPWGNRTQSDFQSTACNPTSDPATASYSTANKVTWTTVNAAVNGFTYDAAGNVLYDRLNYYSYDGEGRLCAVQNYPYSGGVLAYGYVYDAEGRRVAKGTITPSPVGQSPSCNLATNGFTLTESYLLGQGSEQLTTTTWNAGTSTWARTNVYGEGKLLATYDTLGLHFHLTDPLGTRRLQASAQGIPELDCQSLPFGDQMNCFPDPSAEDAGEDATPLHFTGKERDAESGNDYFGARYYSSAMGRFMSPDWSTKPSDIPYAEIADPQTLNLYGYVRNNPLSKIDKDGHCSAPHPGDKQYSVGICIDLYIQARTIYGVGQGDGRGPAANDPKATYRVEIQLAVDPKNGKVMVVKDDAGVSKALFGIFQGKGTSTTSPIAPTTDENGTTHFTLNNTALNGLHDLPGAPQDTIKTTMNMDVTSAGKVGIEGGMRTAYPSLEVYSYDSSGKATSILQMQEHDPSDLANQNQPIPQVAPQ